MNRVGLFASVLFGALLAGAAWSQSPTVGFISKGNLLACKAAQADADKENFGTYKAAQQACGGDRDCKVKVTETYSQQRHETQAQKDICDASLKLDAVGDFSKPAATSSDCQKEQDTSELKATIAKLTAEEACSYKDALCAKGAAEAFAKARSASVKAYGVCLRGLPKLEKTKPATSPPPSSSQSPQ